MRVPRRTLLALALLAGSLALAGLCLGGAPDGGSASHEGAPEAGGADGGEPAPPRAPPASVGSLEHLDHLPARQGFDVAARGDHAYVASRSGFYTVDIPDPEEPVKLEVLREAGSRYVELVDQGDKLVAAASGANQEVLHLVDVTDPEDPELLSSFDPGRTVHNTGVVPGTSLFYNPRGAGDAVEPGIDIVDASDPANPGVVERWSFPETADGEPVRTAGCGVVTFDLSRDRACCPAVTQTYSLDVSDLLDPKVVGVVSNPAIDVHHRTQAIDGGDTLLIADWAAVGNAPNCDDVTPDPLDPPPGAVWAYDISDLDEPEPLGYVDVAPPPAVGPDEQCSPHVVEATSDEDRVAVAWHRAGVALVDVSDPANMQVVDRWFQGGNTWSLDVHGGLVLAPARESGLDVIGLEPGPGSE
jgi:hypothetical protein